MSLAYCNPTQRVIAEGAFEQLPALLAPFRPKHILVVLGERWFRSSAHYPVFQRLLAGYTMEEALPVRSNPSVLDVIQALRVLQPGAQTFDLVISIGGGSVLDVGKMLAVLLPQPCEFSEDDVEQPMVFQHQPLPLIAIPTTAGTGSEVTPYASLETRTQKKITVEHLWLFPHSTLIDPLLTHSMPRYVTACTGFDALCQAIESFWSLRHTPFADTHALRALSLILGGLEQVLKDPHDRGARCAMALASCEAGLAISQTRTTAVHAVSYPLTTLFGIAHGHACALTLASFIRYNGPTLANARGVMLWKALGVASSEEAARRIERLMETVGLERSLKRLGVDEAGLNRIIDNGFRPDRVSNNPRELTPEALREILEGIACPGPVSSLDGLRTEGLRG